MQQALFALKPGDALVERGVHVFLHDLDCFIRDHSVDERVALDKQARCMLDLEEKYKMTQAAALGGEGKQER